MTAEAVDGRAALPRAAIRRGGALPYYAQLAELFRDKIATGEWGPGKHLPSEAAICAFFGISRTAVRQALGELVTEGLVRKEKGRGTFVRGPRRSELVVHELRGFLDGASERGLTVTSEVLLLDVTAASVDEAALLGIPYGADVVRLDRLRRVEGEPVCLARTLLPALRFPALVDQDLRTRGLYDVLGSEYGVEPSGGTRYVEAVAADRPTARALGVRTGVPVLRLASVGTDQTGERFEVFTAWYRGDRTEFRIDVGMPRRV